MILDKIDLLVCCCCCFLKKILFFFTSWDSNICDKHKNEKKKKWNWFIRVNIRSKPAAREQSWHHVCESSLFLCCCSCDFRVWDRGERKKKCGAAVWSVCFIYMRNKKAYQFLSHSHPFTRPASTTLLMIPMHYSKNSLDVCILEKKKKKCVWTHIQSSCDVCQY